MRRLISVGAVLTLFMLGAPIDGAAADAHFQGGPSEQGFGDDPLANPGRQRSAAAPVEPGGPPARSAARGIVSCGEVITKNTTLLRDVGPCPGNGIIIGADNIMLNLNGHTVSGTPGIGDGNAAGIRLPFRTGVSVTGHPGNSGKTGTVTGFDAGVFINGGSRNTIEKLVVTDNVSSGGEALLGDGIVLFHSGKNRLLNNLVARNGPFDGIGVLGSDSNDNLIQGNTVEETVGTPDGMAGEGSGILLNNFLDEQGTPRRGEPIRNNQVLDNVVRRNRNSGISNVTHVLGRIAGNIVEDNGEEVCETVRDRRTGEERTRCGPAAFPSNGIGVTKGPGSTGLAANGVTRMLIANNRVTGNAGDGIALGGPPEFTQVRENRVLQNVATGNGGSGNDFQSPFEASSGRYDLHDFSVTYPPPCEQRPCPEPQDSCDENVWLDNVFNTAYPPCAAGGLASVEGPFGDPTCTDRRDNDLDGAIDAGDPDCMADPGGEEPGGEFPPEPGGELPPPPPPPPPEP